MSNQKPRTIYPLEYRREAVRLCYEEGLTLAEITEQGLGDPQSAPGQAVDAALPTGGGSLLPVGERAVRPAEEGGEHRGIHRPIGDGGRAAKKISVRVARHYVSRSAISGDRVLPGEVPGEHHVCILRSTQESQLLRLAQTGEAARPGWSPDGTGPRSLPVLTRGLRLSAGPAEWIEQHKGITINHKAVLRLMNRMGIRSVARKRKPAPKGHVMDKLYRYPNLLNRDFSAERPNQKWVTDMTHIDTSKAGPRCARSKILMMGSSCPITWAERHDPVGGRNPRQALEKEMVTDGLILHSDQGHQFRSQAYYVLITAYNLTHSMSRKANCSGDNAPMENFFSHLKEEAIRQHPVLPFKEVKQIIQEYLPFSTTNGYN